MLLCCKAWIVNGQDKNRNPKIQTFSMAMLKYHSCIVISYFVSISNVAWRQMETGHHQHNFHRTFVGCFRFRHRSHYFLSKVAASIKTRLFYEFMNSRQGQGHSKFAVISGQKLKSMSKHIVCEYDQNPIMFFFVRRILLEWTNYPWLIF